ncbi:hypothetical protein FB567DRAFT_590546 [Paraphoma chrysanthemicola]|uniref:Cytokinesis regulator n=1 Tax=Paraphoma chrysanthemicola TaxID=798071 RepID=A0A8K0RAK3_9PLEO|nr:hypothetical protein FB567DRAFT_590546 [Paraphoma chrysanthemicola]
MAQRSFASRMASMASNASNTSKFESWDDGDFEESDGLLFKNAAIQSLSSRMSVRSESNTGDDDWQVLLTPNDDLSTNRAIHSAKQAGIPIPTSVPSSALLGGTIKRLGKKKSTRKIEVDDDWGNDLELPSNAQQGLKLKTPAPHTPADDQDDFDDWGEGSLGIRFAGTRRDARGARSSSVSAMSPSLGSCMTLESEDDDLNGLVLPTEPLDFNARLEKLKKTQLPTPDASPLPPQHHRELPPTSAPTSMPTPEFPSPHAQQTPSPFQESPAALSWDSPIEPSPKPKPADDEEDFLDGLDFDGPELLDSGKLTLNRNVVVKKPAAKTAAPPAARPATTITFTDRPTSSRIPRPLPSSSRSRLTPVYETGASTQTTSRPMPTTTSAQLLRAKRSAPVLRSNLNPARGHIPFLPAGNATAQSHHVMSKTSQPQLRRDSDPRRPQSPSMRSYSRMSNAPQSETPSRAGIRRDLAPSALARHPPPKKLTQPQRKRNYGDGHELDSFDDLPTSATKEKVFEKAPRNVASNKSLRQQPSNSRLPMLDRMATPMPQTPRSPPKMDHTPRFARDTAASRNAREQRLAGTRIRGDGPIAPRPMSWAAQVAARSPHTSPTANKKKGSGQKPQLIRQMTQPYTHNEKGMVYNPTMQRWEGNEEALVSFTLPNTSTTTLALTTASTPTFAPPGHPLNRPHDRSHSISHTALSSIHAAQKSFSSRMAKITPTPAPAPAPAAVPMPVPSPPRPALISQISAPRGVLHEGRMVFDPVKMKWLKAARHSNDPRSPSEMDDDEEDPFAGIEDFKDNESLAGGSNAPGGVGSPDVQDPSFVGEEFDVGPGFIRRQREEEAIWRRRTEGWLGGFRDEGEHRGGWKWAIRDFAANASAGASAY